MTGTRTAVAKVAASKGPTAATKLFWRLRGFEPMRNTYQLTEGVDVPMSDGITLKTDVYLPDTADKTPTVFVRTPYGRGRTAFERLNYAFLAARGFTVVVQSTRGTDGSDGVQVPMTPEASDGQDAVEWLRKQSWFDGRLITYGASYSGFVQFALAENPPPELIGAVIESAPYDFASVAYGRGPFDLINFMVWSSLTARQATQSGLSLPAQIKQMKNDEKALRNLLATAPLNDAVPDYIDANAPWYRDWLAHNTRADGYWDGYDHLQGLQNMRCPVLLSGGWQDIFLRQTLKEWTTLQTNGAPVDVLIGPWTHLDGGKLALSAAHPNRLIHWLDALVDGRQQEPVHRVAITGTKKPTWRNLDSWPPAPARVLTFHGDQQKQLSERESTVASRTVFTYDPASPTPFIGGGTMTSMNGVQDNAELEKREDVVVYTSAPFDGDTLVVGVPTVALEVETTNGDFDLFVRVCDVDAKGASRNVCDEIIRITGDGLSDVHLDLQGAAQLFPKGHRVRLQISGGAFPRYAVNPAIQHPCVYAIADRSVLLTLPVATGS